MSLIKPQRHLRPIPMPLRDEERAYDLTRWGEWLQWQLGSPSDRFIGTYGVVTCLQKLREAHADNETRVADFDRRIAMARYRIRLIESMIEKGWDSQPNAPLGENEQRLYRYLRLQFYVQRAYNYQWDNPNYRYLSVYIRHYARLYYEPASYPTHDSKAREAKRRAEREVASAH